MKPEIRLKRICKFAFPDYKGRKFFVSVGFPPRIDSYWTEGSRDYWAFIDLETLAIFQVHSNHPAFEPKQPSIISDPEALPPNVALVRRSIFCGKEMGLTLYLRGSQIFFTRDSLPLHELTTRIIPKGELL